MRKTPIIIWIIRLNRKIIRYKNSHIKTKIFSTHQRLNVKHGINTFSTTSVCHIPNIEFCNWLLQVTDGDGSFSFSVNKKKNRIWNCTFKIGQNIYNYKMYNYIKQEYGFGSLNLKSGAASNGCLHIRSCRI